MDVSNKAALITGGGSGIGRASALALAAQGCNVAVSYNNSSAAAAEVVAEAEALGVKAIAIQGDVANDVDCRRVASEAAEALGGIDVLINSAGTTVFVDHGDLEGLESDHWHELYAINTMGPFQMMRACADHLRAGDGGEVINISSVAGVAGVGSSLPYCASKAALNNLTITMARVLAPEVRVNAVAPGFVTGRWWIEGRGEETHEAMIGALTKSTPLKGVCSPEDVAASIMGLVNGSDLATGQIVVLDGGMLIKLPR